MPAVLTDTEADPLVGVAHAVREQHASVVEHDQVTRMLVWPGQLTLKAPRGSQVIRCQQGKSLGRSLLVRSAFDSASGQPVPGRQEQMGGLTAMIAANQRRISPGVSVVVTEQHPGLAVVVIQADGEPPAEVFNEYYHLPYVHPGSIDDTYDDPDDPEVVVGAWATHAGTTQGTGGLLEADQKKALPVIGTLNEREAHGVRYSWLYPTLVTATGAEGMWMYEVYPDGPDRCRCAQVVCFPPETAALEGFAEVAEAYYERFDVAIAEDIPMLERQHRGMRSPFARQGRFSYLEPNVARFAGWYADRLLSVG